MRKLNFSQLLQELEVITQEETKKIKGGVVTRHRDPVIWDNSDLFNVYGEYNYYDNSGFGGGGAGVYVPLPYVTGVMGDFNMSHFGWVAQEGVGVLGSWTATGNYSLSSNYDQTGWQFGVNLSVMVPPAYDNPELNGNGILTIDGSIIGSFTLYDPTQYGTVISPNDSSALSGHLTLSDSFRGGFVNVEINIGVYNDTGAGRYGNAESSSFWIYIPEF